MTEDKKILFVGGGSEIALKILSNLKNYKIYNLSRNKYKSYEKNYIVKNYSASTLNKIFNKIENKFDLIFVFNGIFELSTLSILNEKKFLDVININLLTPIRVINKLIEHDLLLKNANVVFLSSEASIKPEIGNAYYAVSKNALNFVAKILQKENKRKFVRFNLISLGMINNQMGEKVKNLIKLNKKPEKRIKNTGFLNLIKYIKSIIKDNKKVKKNILIK